MTSNDDRWLREKTKWSPSQLRCNFFEIPSMIDERSSGFPYWRMLGNLELDSKIKEVGALKKFDLTKLEGESNDDKYTNAQ